MRAHRFGNKIKLPSTLAIKYQLLTMMFEDEIRAIPTGGHFEETNRQRSPCCNGLAAR